MAECNIQQEDSGNFPAEIPNSTAKVECILPGGGDHGTDSSWDNKEVRRKRSQTKQIQAAFHRLSKRVKSNMFCLFAGRRGGYPSSGSRGIDCSISGKSPISGARSADELGTVSSSYCPGEALSPDSSSVTLHADSAVQKLPTQRRRILRRPSVLFSPRQPGARYYDDGTVSVLPDAIFPSTVGLLPQDSRYDSTTVLRPSSLVDGRSCFEHFTTFASTLSRTASATNLDDTPLPLPAKCNSVSELAKTLNTILMPVNRSLSLPRSYMSATARLNAQSDTTLLRPLRQRTENYIKIHHGSAPDVALRNDGSISDRRTVVTRQPRIRKLGQDRTDILVATGSVYDYIPADGYGTLPDSVETGKERFRRDTISRTTLNLAPAKLRSPRTTAAPFGDYTTVPNSPSLAKLNTLGQVENLTLEDERNKDEDRSFKSVCNHEVFMNMEVGNVVFAGPDDTEASSLASSVRIGSEDLFEEEAMNDSDIKSRVQEPIPHRQYEVTSLRCNLPEVLTVDCGEGNNNAGSDAGSVSESSVCSVVRIEQRSGAEMIQFVTSDVAVDGAGGGDTKVLPEWVEVTSDEDSPVPGPAAESQEGSQSQRPSRESFIPLRRTLKDISFAAMSESEQNSVL